MEENSDLNFSELQNSELLKILHKNETECLLLHKEKDLYEIILNEKKNLFQNYLATEEYNLSSLEAEDINVLKYVEKCHFMKKCLACLVKILEIKDTHKTTELQELKFKLKSTNNKLLLLKDEADQFKAVILMKSKHPITKKIILQRVQKYFHDSIQNKMSMANRIKTQIESFTMERHKILKQMNEQKKRLASLDAVKYQETKLEYLRICEFLVAQREHLAKCKYKFNSLAAQVAEIKKTLIEQEKNIIEMKSEVMKMEETKTTMHSERVRNEKEIHNLNEAMRKIKLDPRSHDLPEIFEYAIIKRQNESLKCSIKHWKKKLTIAEELKLVHLNKQLKKKR